jgi:ankyrin repeat protein
MQSKLTPQTNLESLRKEAKRWLKELRSGDGDSLERLKRIHPQYRTLALRTVQHAIALEYGFSNWTALKQALDDRALALRTHVERVTLFLDKAANRYGVAPGTTQWNTAERDNPSHGERAARVLARHPEIVRDSIHTAVGAHDIEAVHEFLSRDPALADQRGGPDGWTPLLRLAYTRLPIDAVSKNAVEIATLLLDHGADPNASWSDSANDFTVLTGVIGGGEGRQSAHPQAEPLARLLISRGAQPLDLQALYNTSLESDSTFWLELLWSESRHRGEAEKWTTPATGRLGFKAGITTVDYLLGNAVPRHPQRVAWLLGHGANAKTIHFYSRMPVIRHAVLAGQQDIIEMLVQHGAERPILSGAERFLAATMQGDVSTVRALAKEHPQYLKDPHAMFAAIVQRRADIAEILLDAGTSPSVGDHRGFTALHQTTHTGSPEIASLLIARGADVDAVERSYNGTPLGHANYQGRKEMVAVIAPHSRDIRGLCLAGCVERLSALLSEDASLARAITLNGEPPLFALPDDDEGAVEVVELLLAHGADPSVKNSAGLTPADVAMKRGLEDAAAALT